MHVICVHIYAYMNVQADNVCLYSVDVQAWAEHACTCHTHMHACVRVYIIRYPLAGSQTRPAAPVN